ncbi:hypothetical protein B7494_g7576, partial [Chlorociboria aeruginascens]
EGDVKEKKIAALEQEMQKMKEDFQWEVSSLSHKLAAETESAAMWQTKYSALNQTFLNNDAELRMFGGTAQQREERERDIKTRISSLMLDRDSYREAYNELLAEGKAKEDVIVMLQSQVRGLKSFVSANSKMDEQVTDEAFGERMQKLGNGLQNWVISNFRRAKIDPEKANDETKQTLLRLVPTYEGLVNGCKIHFIQSLVSRLLVESVFQEYFIGLPNERQDELKRVESFLSTLESMNQWRSTTLAILRKEAPQKLQDETTIVVEKFIQEINGIMHAITDVQTSEGRDQSLRGLITSSIELSRLLRAQKAEFTVTMPLIEDHQREMFDGSSMEDIGGEDEDTLHEREIRCVTFPGILKNSRDGLMNGPNFPCPQHGNLGIDDLNLHGDFETWGIGPIPWSISWRSLFAKSQCTRSSSVDGRLQGFGRLQHQRSPRLIVSTINTNPSRFHHIQNHLPPFRRQIGVNYLVRSLRAAASCETSTALIFVPSNSSFVSESLRFQQLLQCLAMDRFLNDQEEPRRPGYYIPRKVAIHASPPQRRILPVATPPSDVSTVSSISRNSAVSGASTVTKATSVSHTTEELLDAVPDVYGYDLPCEFEFQGCGVRLHPTNFEAWISHSVSHFGGHPPPSYSICIFCDKEVFENPSDPSLSWRERMIHIGGHLADPALVQRARPDFWVIEYVYDHGLISPEDYQHAKGYTERPFCPNLVPPGYRTPEMIRKKEKELQIHDDLQMEERQRRKANHKGKQQDEPLRLSRRSDRQVEVRYNDNLPSPRHSSHTEK